MLLCISIPSAMLDGILYIEGLINWGFGFTPKSLAPFSF